MSVLDIIVVFVFPLQPSSYSLNLEHRFYPLLSNIFDDKKRIILSSLVVPLGWAPANLSAVPKKEGFSSLLDMRS